MRKVMKMQSRPQRGSALLVTLMVVVGLSLLGLGFVAMSETESAISVNQRNYAQAQVVSEAAARVVVDWYNAPNLTTSLRLMPHLTDNAAEIAAMKRDRMIDVDGDGTLENIGKYKVHPELFCCDKPFKPGQTDRLWGTENSPDIVINDTTAPNFLLAWNNRLFGDRNNGQVTDIRIFAPPIVGAVGTPNAQGFYDKDPGAGNNPGTRYGLATVLVTAQVRRDPSNPATTVSERRTRMVISEWPFPGPQGPIQSNANIQTGGNVVVHWGKMTSQGSMFVKRALSGLPWHNAHDRIAFEYGWDSSVPYAANTFYALGAVVRHPTSPHSDFDYEVRVAGTSGAANPTPCTTPIPAIGSTCTNGGITFRVRNRSHFPIDNTSADYRAHRNWLAEVTNLLFDDPWVEARARGPITNTAVAGNAALVNNPHPFKYSNPVTQPADGDPVPALSNWFQRQDRTDPRPSDYKEVVFPRIDYNFWKDLAIAGRGTEGVHYLKWVAADTFTDGLTTKSFKNWTNIATGAKPGFYFFDTRNSQNPQVPGGSAFLTPAVSVSSAGGNIWTMSGFIYLNAVAFGTTGIRGVDGWFNFPGEPYLDDGFYLADKAAAGMPITYVKDPAHRGNRNWDYQDLNDNGEFDVWVENRTVTLANGTNITQLFPVIYFDGCNVGVNCSEPHEPYMNLQYPADACCKGGSLPYELRVGWQPNTTPTRRPKEFKDDGSMPNCTLPAEQKHCTSNGYDRDGELDFWSGAQDAPVLNGVFYNEGEFRSTGNARYFGSVLINGNVDSTGTNEVWFDERLIKDEWPPQDWPFPRVFITAIQTDEQ